MTVPVDIPLHIKQIVGPLPPPGQSPGDDFYPYETIVPVRDGFVERDGVRTYFAVWGESGPTIVFAPLYQIVHMQALKATVPYLSRHFQVVTMDLRGEWALRSTGGASCLQFRPLLCRPVNRSRPPYKQATGHPWHLFRGHDRDPPGS